MVAERWFIPLLPSVPFAPPTSAPWRPHLLLLPTFPSTPPRRQLLLLRRERLHHQRQDAVQRGEARQLLAG